MPTENERGSRNAFTADFLSSLDEVGEPDGAHEADVAGPWVIVPVPRQSGSGFAVLREWESLEAGDVPYAVFRRRETALLAAAVLPATGREPLFRLATDPGPAGFPLWAAAPAPGEGPGRRAGSVESAATGPQIAANAATGPNIAANAATGPQIAANAATSPNIAADESQAAGHLRDFDEGLAAAINVAAAVVRSPACLALLLESAGAIALAQAGRILHRRRRQAAAAQGRA
jgi:hypothetical protein